VPVDEALDSLTLSWKVSPPACIINEPLMYKAKKKSRERERRGEHVCMQSADTGKIKWMTISYEKSTHLQTQVSHYKGKVMKADVK
jgi:hypothetical protein